MTDIMPMDPLHEVKIDEVVNGEADLAISLAALAAKKNELDFQHRIKLDGHAEVLVSLKDGQFQVAYDDVNFQRKARQSVVDVIMQFLAIVGADSKQFTDRYFTEYQAQKLKNSLYGVNTFFSHTKPPKDPGPTNKNGGPAAPAA